MRSRFFLLILVCALLAVPTPARADGIIIPEPPPCPPGSRCLEPDPMVQLAIRYHHVTVTIQDQVAITHVDQVFYNPNNWAVEGTYLFPLPANAAVSAFKLWVDGEPVEGKVLDAQQARQTYQEIVSRMQDPALLEYAGRGAVRASIFPIPPQGERRIELEYSQVLTAENGLVRYVYPLSTEKFSARPLDNVTVRVAIQSSVPVRAVYSPSHAIALQRESEYRVSAGYEESNVLPEADFALYYSIGENEAFHLIPYRDPEDPTDPDGFFLLLLAPSPDASAETLSKDVILVLDRSGSMEGEKFQQAQEALRYVLNHLNPDDRFNLIAFSTDLETYAPVLTPASERDAAIAWVNRLSAAGSTDINRALLEAAALAAESRGERPAYLIFLTDGLPTEGVVDSQAILDNLEQNAPDHLRLFAFGVGYDVDTFLLDSLAQAHHGTSSYVLPGERLDEALSAFYAKVSAPVLTNLALDFGDLAVYDVFPDPLPDLFAGSQIAVVGRYIQGGQTDVTLTGWINGQQQTFRYPGQNFEMHSPAGSHASATARLWATRKIGYLLNQVRLNGANQELIDQIVRLSIRFGIVTPYTSYLVTEPLPLGEAEQERIAVEQFSRMQAAPTQAVSGQAAVEAAKDQGSLSAAELPASVDPTSADQVQVVGARTFVFSDGRWVDTGFDPEKMSTIKIPFLSEKYFDLANSHADIAAAFALGPEVTVLSGGKAYEVVAQEEGTQQPGPAPTQAATVLPAETPADPGETSVPHTGFPWWIGFLPLAFLPLVGWILFRKR